MTNWKQKETHCFARHGRYFVIIATQLDFKNEKSKTWFKFVENI